MDEQLDLFEEISAEEFQTAHSVSSKSPPKSRRARVAKTEPRNNTTWYALPHSQGFCTCPAHDEIQQLLNPEEKVYRQKYPVRMVYPITATMDICRDCFVNGGDKDGESSTLV